MKAPNQGITLLILVSRLSSAAVDSKVARVEQATFERVESATGPQSLL